MSFSLISTAQAAGEAAAPQAGGTVELIMIAVFVGIFYFLILRPQNKRQKQHREMITSLEVGDEIVINGGILGKIKKVKDSFLVVTVSEGVELKLQSHAVSAVLPKGTFKSV